MQRKVEDSKLVGSRLDTYLATLYPNWTRSYIKSLIDKGYVFLNGKNVKAGAKIRLDDEITIKEIEVQTTDVVAQDIPLDIIYEDNDIAVINKPQGMVTHPAVGNREGTLVNALLYHITDLAGIGGEIRPGIVHRLDKDTSGVLVIAKNDAAHNDLSEQMAAHTMEKLYTALVFGNIKEEGGSIKAPIGRDRRDRKKMAVVRQGGREAHSCYKVLKRYLQYTLVEVSLKTGRTHQIRVHMKHVGHPVVGDKVYTRQKSTLYSEGQLLHATKLTFDHPTTKERVSFSAPLPDYFNRVLESLTEV